MIVKHSPTESRGLDLLLHCGVARFILLRVRELSETVLKESAPCAIRLLTPTRWLRIANAPSKKAGVERPLASLPPPTSQLAVVKSAAPGHHRFGFLSRRRRIDTSQSLKVARKLTLDQNGHKHEICTQDLTPPTHQKHCQFVLLTPLRSVHHGIQQKLVNSCEHILVFQAKWSEVYENIGL